jgi:hypothetical protein
MKSNEHRAHFTDTHFKYFPLKHNDMYIFSTQGHLYKQMVSKVGHVSKSQYTYAAAAWDTALWFVT